MLWHLKQPDVDGHQLITVTAQRVLTLSAAQWLYFSLSGIYFIYYFGLEDLCTKPYVQV
jgi:hypothetical protein